MPAAGQWPAAPQQIAQPIVVKNGPGCLKIGLIVVFILVLLGGGTAACIAFTANNVVNELERQTGKADEADYDITLTTCTIGTLGLEANGSITNTSKEKQAFEIKVRFTAPDGALVSEDVTFTDPINPGQSTDYEVPALKPDAPAGTRCALVAVNYTVFDDQND
jgi:hypothetical protein